jgi:S1-C subfamily serine protease
VKSISEKLPIAPYSRKDGINVFPLSKFKNIAVRIPCGLSYRTELLLLETGMRKKHPMRITPRQQQWLLRSILLSGITTFYLFSLFFQSTSAYAEGVPGGNIKDPVIRAVDIAKPAVVRIITSLNGRLTVYFSLTQHATFPTDGGTYQLQLSGSGAFISSHGDILTAAHVTNPPHDQSMNQAIYTEAAQDVADYINNNLNPPTPWDAANAYAALSSNTFLSTTEYEQPTSKVYLSTDYTGEIDATKISNLPAGIAVDVDKIEKESPTDQKDIAIIHVPLEDTPSVKLGDASAVAQQDELTIIGFPGNGDVSEKGDPTSVLTSSVNKIYVSALKKTDNGASVIQVGGNVEHGDSGGPALNSAGEIVGVVSFGLASDTPQGTAFLQSSESVQELMQSLSLDTRPGQFQQMWNQAYANYTSTAPGHWQEAQQSFKNLQTKYPDFKAVEPYMAYVTKQATKEAASSNTEPETNWGLIAIVAVIVVGILLIVLLLLIQRRRKNVLNMQIQPAGFAQYGGQMPPSSIPGFGIPPGNGATPSPAAYEQAVFEQANGQLPPSQPWQPAAAPLLSGPQGAQQPPVTPWGPAPVQQQSPSFAAPAPQVGPPSSPNIPWPPAVQQASPAHYTPANPVPPRSPAVVSPTPVFNEAVQPAESWRPAPYSAPGGTQSIPAIPRTPDVTNWEQQATQRPSSATSSMPAIFSPDRRPAQPGEQAPPNGPRFQEFASTPALPTWHSAPPGITHGEQTQRAASNGQDREDDTDKRHIIRQASEARVEGERTIISPPGPTNPTDQPPAYNQEDRS